MNPLPIDAQNATESPENAASSSCCATGSCLLRRAMWGLTAAVVFVGLVGLGLLAWTIQNQSSNTPNRWQIPAVVDASAAVSSDKFSVATGFVGEAEGFFVLDHNSGLLQCSVIYPRIGQFSAMFTINVADAVGVGAKGGSYLMVTGAAEFPNASNRPLAQTLVYVLNTATGTYAAYAIPFDRTAANARASQQGTLILMGTGQANPVASR